MKLLSGLIDQTAAEPADAVVDLQQQFSAPYGTALGSLLVPDTALTAVDRVASGSLPVTVINTSGAGGLVSLAGRHPEKLRIVAVDNSIRDLADPVGNIARYASAARELDPDTIVRVRIPGEVHDYADAAAAAEAEELQGLLVCTDPPAELTNQLSAAVEADLPFAIFVDSPTRLVGLLRALDAIIDTASVEEAERLLTVRDPAADAAAIADWDDQRVGRIRRRLTAVRVEDPVAVLDQLTAWGVTI